MTTKDASGMNLPARSPLVAVCGVCLAVVMLCMGCQTTPKVAGSTGRSIPAVDRQAIRQLVCLFDQRPWLNLDAAGDEDPEGFRFRVFLDTGSGQGIHRDGKFYIQLYQIGRTPQGDLDRKLVSDWHLATEDIQPLKSKMLGYGYHIMLRWATKSIAGHEVEVVTTFEDAYGRKVRSGTKRLRVPKYNT